MHLPTISPEKKRECTYRVRDIFCTAVRKGSTSASGIDRLHCLRKISPWAYSDPWEHNQRHVVFTPEKRQDLAWPDFHSSKCTTVMAIRAKSKAKVSARLISVSNVNRITSISGIGTKISQKLHWESGVTSAVAEIWRIQINSCFPGDFSSER